MLSSTWYRRRGLSSVSDREMITSRKRQPWISTIFLSQFFTLSLGPGNQYGPFVGAAGMGLTPHVQSLSQLCLGYLLQLCGIDVKSKVIWPHSRSLTYPASTSHIWTCTTWICSYHYEPAPPGFAVIIGINMFLFFSTPGNIRLMV